jgi:hypothetical protein
MALGSNSSNLFGDNNSNSNMNLTLKDLRHIFKRNK